MNLLQTLEAEQVASLAAERPRPEFWPGDTVKVNVRVVEGTRERIQAYEGVVIAKKNRGLNSASPCAKFPITKVLSGYSPCIHRASILLRCSNAAVCAVPSCITCASVAENPRVLPRKIQAGPPSCAMLNAPRSRPT